MRLPFLIVLLSILLPVLHAHAITTLEVRFAKSLDNNTWFVQVRLEHGNQHIECSGVLKPNLYYMQTKTISSTLIATSIYYILDTVCPQAVNNLNRVEDVLRVVLYPPPGYTARSCMDWRGFGPLGGPYTLPSRLFKRHYIYDAIVIADVTRYTVLDDSRRSMTLVVDRTLANTIVSIAAEVVSTVRAFLSDRLGPSPRDPRIIVVAAPSEHPYMPAGVACSTGSLIYVKVETTHIDLPWFIHVVAHEAVHGWLNYGLLYGSFDFQEALAEFLAAKALATGKPVFYEIMLKHLRVMLEAGERYSTWFRLHTAIWYMTLKLCNKDLYTTVLRELFQEALTSNTGMHITIFGLVKRIVDDAPRGCRESLERLLAPILAASVTGREWPFIDTQLLDRVIEQMGVSGTVTIVKTFVETVTVTRSILSCRSRAITEGEGGYPLSVVAAASIAGFVAGLAFTYVLTCIYRGGDRMYGA